MTRFKRISGVTGKATARRLVIVNLALRVDPARSYARVLALVVDAGFRVSAIRVLHALWPTTLVWVTGVIGQTSARARAIAFFAHGVRAARRRIARHLHWEDDCEAKNDHSKYANYKKMMRHPNITPANFI